jgi:hypothetical protein
MGVSRGGGVVLFYWKIRQITFSEQRRYTYAITNLRCSVTAKVYLRCSVIVEVYLPTRFSFSEMYLLYTLHAQLQRRCTVGRVPTQKAKI